MKLRKLILLSTILTLLSSCGGNSSSNTPISSNDIPTSIVSGETNRVSDKKGNVVEIRQDVIETDASVTFDDLFDLSNKVEVSIEASHEELTKLNDDYSDFLKSDIYRHAEKVTLSITKGTKKYTNIYYDVGLRQKGNMSREFVFNENGEFNNSHYKLSFDETFDDEKMYGDATYVYTGNESYYTLRKDRNFLGLSGLDFKWNRNEDASYVKEIYASHLYHKNGVLAQHIGLSTFKLKDTDTNKELNLGTCLLYEQTKKDLIKHSLKEYSYLNMGTWKEEKEGTYGVPDKNYGDLYKVSYGHGEGAYGRGGDLSVESGERKRIGIKNISGSYIPVYDRKTNKDVEYNDGQLKYLLISVNRSYESIEKVVDLEYFALTEAVSYIIGNPDDMRNNTNNYMIYFRRTDGKAIFIPIDYDRCFGITKSYNPDGNGLMYAGPFDTINANGRDVINLYRYSIFLDNSQAKKDYIKYLKQVRDSISLDEYNSLYEKAKATYSGEDKIIKFGLTDENISFSNYLKEKTNTLNEVLSNYDDNPNKGYIGECYLNGSFASWNAGKNYPFTYSGYGTYTITVTINKDQLDENGHIQCKIYDGVDYSSIDFTLTDYNTKLLYGKGQPSFDIDMGKKTRVLTIEFNTLRSTACIGIQ
jgi:spore coat protein CotH